MVTGGAGFLGTYCTEVLRGEHHDFMVFDRGVDPGLDVLNEASVLACSREVDAVINLAGLLGTSELFDRPHEAVNVNIQGTINVLRACERNSLRYVGITMPDVWSNVYQATKYCARRLASSWHIHRGVHVTHVRAFNAYGAGQKIWGVQKILPTFSYRGWRGDPLPIWGDGRQCVDLIHASDVARALIAALSTPGQDEIIDAGTGSAHTVLEVARLVLETTRSSGGVEYLPMRQGEVPTRIVAIGEGWEYLSQRPIYDEAQVIETINSYRERALS